MCKMELLDWRTKQLIAFRRRFSVYVKPNGLNPPGFLLLKVLWSKTSRIRNKLHGNQNFANILFEARNNITHLIFHPTQSRPACQDQARIQLQNHFCRQTGKPALDKRAYLRRKSEISAISTKCCDSWIDFFTLSRRFIYILWTASTDYSNANFAKLSALICASFKSNRTLDGMASSD